VCDVLGQLKAEVLQANKDLVKYGLVTFTWGNVSGFDRNSGLIVIKPSGVPYETLNIKDLVVLDLDGNIVEGNLKPSSDTPTHLELYKRFPQISGIVHTHSEWATSWAQAGKSIPVLGTTHADYFYGDIPCTRKMTTFEIEQSYEKETGTVIIEEIGDRDPLKIPGILVNSHGPFAWGKSPENAVHNAVVLEEVAKMALRTYSLNPNIKNIERSLLDKHFLRKHGEAAYYGQNQ